MMKRQDTKLTQKQKILLDHAIIVPYSIDGGGFEASRISVLEGEYAPYGVANLRYKFKTLHDDSMSMDEFSDALAQWEKERSASIASETDAETVTEAATE